MPRKGQKSNSDSKRHNCFICYKERKKETKTCLPACHKCGKYSCKEHLHSQPLVIITCRTCGIRETMMFSD